MSAHTLIDKEIYHVKSDSGTPKFANMLDNQRKFTNNDFYASFGIVFVH